MSVNLPTPQSPLMALIEFEKQSYYTSQYFHKQYVNNSEIGKGKYRLHQNFLAALRSIPTYQHYIATGDIQELSWEKGGYIRKFSGKFLNEDNMLASLFRATSFNPVTLINATAQAALTHHLDDELSKQMSVAINTQAARQESTPTVLLAKHDMQTWKELAELFGAPMHIALQEGVKYVEKTYNLDFRPLLLASPVLNAIDDNEMMLEPTDLARYLHYASGAAMNKALETLGWQRKSQGQWEATPTGTPHSTRHAWINQGKSGYNLKWNVQAVRTALAHHST